MTYGGLHLKDGKNTMMYRLIGDVHGKWASYKDIIDNSPYPTIQVGDYGLGFYNLDVSDEPMYDYVFGEDNQKHTFIRGNHDNPETCKQMPNWIKDGSIADNTMFVGGAWSIDHAWRTEGIDWWADEELSNEELYRIVEMYSVAKPEIMITHDCPQSVSTKWIIEKGFAMGGNAYKTRTAQALDAMLSLHVPKLWIFGHWHVNIDIEWNDTRFICLNELDWCDVNMKTCEVQHHRFWKSKL